MTTIDLNRDAAMARDAPATPNEFVSPEQASQLLQIRRPELESLHQSQVLLLAHVKGALVSAEISAACEVARRWCQRKIDTLVKDKGQIDSRDWEDVNPSLDAIRSKLETGLPKGLDQTEAMSKLDGLLEKTNLPFESVKQAGSQPGANQLRILQDAVQVLIKVASGASSASGLFREIAEDVLAGITSEVVRLLADADARADLAARSGAEADAQQATVGDGVASEPDRAQSSDGGTVTWDSNRTAS